jgi:hypothetical protein
MPPEASATEISIQLSMRNFNLNLFSVVPQGNEALILECRLNLTRTARHEAPETGRANPFFESPDKV